MTKSELKDIIRECLYENINIDALNEDTEILCEREVMKSKEVSDLMRKMESILLEAINTDAVVSCSDVRVMNTGIFSALFNSFGKGKENKLKIGVMYNFKRCLKNYVNMLDSDKSLDIKTAAKIIDSLDFLTVKYKTTVDSEGNVTVTTEIDKENEKAAKIFKEYIFERFEEEFSVSKVEKALNNSDLLKKYGLKFSVATKVEFNINAGYAQFFVEVEDR